MRDYLVEAVELIARDGYRLLPDYGFDPHTGLWRHREGTSRPPVRLTGLRYDEHGALVGAQRHERFGEDVLAAHLSDARAVLAARPDVVEGGPTGLSEEFEALRWFVLPPSCVVAADTSVEILVDDRCARE